ncbi:hypothetical protein [Mangrovimonas sp. TPBH4]|uniref:hypothetical protein n=1 Tax=Mangrovimonas sp. TPBH4 TaxID=1645914 RepID=UPI0006B5AC00|nr:hypothetical protein [Mangrovimonas sp. TPBH4]
MLIRNVFALLVIVFLGCSGSKTTSYEVSKKSPIEIIRATFIQNDDSYNVEIVLNDEDNLEVDSLYLSTGVFKPKVIHFNVFSEEVKRSLDSVAQARGPVSAQLGSHQTSYPDELLRTVISLDIEENRLQADTNYSNPFQLKDYEVVIAIRKRKSLYHVKTDLVEFTEYLKSY